MKPSNIPLPQALKTRLRPLAQRLNVGNRKGPYQGYVEGIATDGVLRGWVIDRRSQEGRIQVGFFAGDLLVGTAEANQRRDDVRAALGYDAICGYEFLVTGEIKNKLAEHGKDITVKVLGAKDVVLGSAHVETTSQTTLGKSDNTLLRHAINGDLIDLLNLLQALPQDVQAPKPFEPAPLKIHEKMFSTAPILPDVPQSGQPAYMDYVRYRYRMDENYDVAPGLEVADRFLFWYLTAYRSQEKRRIPLSADTLEYLNSPLVMGGQKNAISRIMWWRLAGRPDLLANTNLNDRDSYLNTLFWWAHQDCPHLYFEDCLVPDRFADMLRGVHPSRRLDAYPLSYFTERFFNQTPALHFLNPGTDEGRKNLALTMLIKAVNRPDLLRYIPHQILEKLLDDTQEGGSDLSKFISAMCAVETMKDKIDPPYDRITKAQFAHVLRQKEFDLTSLKFLTRSQEGHRFEAAAMPRPETGTEVDVQLIGPLAKASGLGQATRLSASILRETDLSVRGVDFDLDNPAPEGFSSDTMIEEYGPSKINIIHLNAESIPLAFAYQPDVFSDRYNIGYFFWELDRPAYCHYLGMDMLDEIWVSTEYGVEIYTPDSNGKPVINVGMCYEDIPDISKKDARDFVNGKFLFNTQNYVCLVAFDSFSFVQRKNPVAVLQAFQKAFEGVPEARLIVKTQNRDSVFDTVQMRLWDQVDAITSKDSRIVVLNETLTYNDLLRLKAGCDCYISLHKSEGWGFGMIEAMNLGVPVVCTAYSGNMDFCSDKTAWLVESTPSRLQLGEYIFVRNGSMWVEPSVDHAAQQLRAAYDNPKKRLQKAKAAQNYIRKNFSAKAISKRYGTRIKEILRTL